MEGEGSRRGVERCNNDVSNSVSALKINMFLLGRMGLCNE